MKEVCLVLRTLTLYLHTELQHNSLDIAKTNYHNLWTNNTILPKYLNTILISWKCIYITYRFWGRKFRFPFGRYIFEYTRKRLLLLITTTQAMIPIMHMDLASTSFVVVYICSNGFDTYPLGLLHDDVIKWEHLLRNWPFMRGIHRSPVNSPHKGQWRGALMFSLICVWINEWVNNRKAGDLKRYRAHHDAIAMTLAPGKSYYCSSATETALTIIGGYNNNQ